MFLTELPNEPGLFNSPNPLLSSLFCALAIIAFFLLSWLIKKLFKNNTNKGLTILNLAINIVLTITFIIGILFILGLDMNILWSNIVSFMETDNLKHFLADNVTKVIGVILVIVISTILMTSFVAILKATNTKKPDAQKRKRTLDKILISIVRYIVIIIDVVIILLVLGFDVMPALAGLGIAGLVLGLGAQKLITDFISGLFIIFERHFDIGDTIEVGGFKGEVIDIGLKTTKIRNWQGQVKIMSNSDVTNLINCSLNNTVFSTTFDVSYQADVEKAIEVVNKELPLKLKDNQDVIVMPVCNGVASLTARSVTLNVVATAKPEAHYQLTRDMNTYIKEILETNNIKFPGDDDD